MRQAILRTTTLTALAALLVAGCGEKDESTAPEPAPEASAFPDPGKGDLQDLVEASAPGDGLVVSPAGQVFTVGRNRLGLGVFTVEREQITDADVAIYAASGADGRVQGPYPARVESLETEPAFTAENTASDPDAAKAVYVTDLELDQPGEWRMVALVRQDDEFAAVTMPSILVRANDPVPAPGDQAPSVHTPTANQVSNIEEIDTRVPPSSMHEDDLADVLGERPVVLLFATPALCFSRVCGPVVDVAEQVKRDHEDDAAFIHMEIYNDNLVDKGVREQVEAYSLPTEPWLFVIDCEGEIDTRIEGAFSVAELSDAVERVEGSC